MRVIPVLDLRSGRAVLARRGPRAAYPAARSVLVPEEQAGDARALARAFRVALGCEECYVADLDGITRAAPQRALLRSLAEPGVRLLVDSGARTPAGAQDALADGAARAVIGLETLPSFAALRDVVRAVGPERVVFSLDLRGGRAVRAPGAGHRGAPLELVDAARDAGAAAVLVLDLARVGSGAGVDLELVAALRRRHPGVELLAGGGVGALGDLARLAEAGCDGALLASALHDGRVGRQEIEAVRRRGDPRRAGHASDSR